MTLFFFYSHLHPRDLHSFPTRRSSDLREAEGGRVPQGIDRRSVAVVRTGRGGRFPAAGLAGGHCCPCGIQRMDLAPRAWFPCRVERDQPAGIARRHVGTVCDAVSISARRAPAVEGRGDWRGGDRRAVHDRSTGDRFLSRTGQHHDELWRRRLGDDPAVVGLLLLPDPALWRRVHARVGRAPWRQAETGGLRGEGSQGDQPEVRARLTLTNSAGTMSIEYLVPL